MTHSTKFPQQTLHSKRGDKGSSWQMPSVVAEQDVSRASQWTEAFLRVPEVTDGWHRQLFTPARPQAAPPAPLYKVHLPVMRRGKQIQRDTLLKCWIYKYKIIASNNRHPPPAMHLIFSNSPPTEKKSNYVRAASSWVCGSSLLTRTQPFRIHIIGMAIITKPFVDVLFLNRICHDLKSEGSFALF